MNRSRAVKKRSVRESGDVFESIHTIMHLFRSEQYRVLRDGPYELTHMEGKLLGFFDRNPGATLSDLVGHTGRDKGQLARLVRSLREQGLLTGEGDAGDRRSIRLHLTPEGKSIHQTLRCQVEVLSKIAIKGLTAGERRQLVSLLDRIRTNLDAVSDTPSK